MPLPNISKIRLNMRFDSILIAAYNPVSGLNQRLLVDNATGALLTATTFAGVMDVDIVANSIGLATEATLAALSAKITACDTTGLATEATLAGLAGTDFATETTLAAFRDKISVDRYNNIRNVASDVGNQSLHTSLVKKEIWGDDYLLFFDDAEGDSGTTTPYPPTVKWLPSFNRQPYTIAANVVAYRTDWSGVPPKEGNSMIILENENDQLHGVSEADAYVKLGEIDEKKISIELWWNYIRNDNYTPTDAVYVTLGFYQFMPVIAGNGFQERRFLVRYYITALGVCKWQYYNAGGTWTDIVDDYRPFAETNTVWNANDRTCWNYAKLTVNCGVGDDYKYLEFTSNDSTWAINQDCSNNFIGSTTSQMRSALCPYIMGRFACSLVSGEVWLGALCIDKVRVYCNDLQSYKIGTAASYGQKIAQG